jgi:hypothetical protein
MRLVPARLIQCIGDVALEDLHGKPLLRDGTFAVTTELEGAGADAW